MEILSFFACNQWNFDDQNTAVLYSNLSKEDQEIFNFDLQNIDYREYLTSVFIGFRKYILKDGLTDTLYARRKMKVLMVLTIILLLLYFYCLFRMLWFVLSILFYFIFILYFYFKELQTVTLKKLTTNLAK